MIPLKLIIKNFLSYGAELQTVDFSTYPLICLSGKNGHGKSALLDAMTWALWGQARKTMGTAKADQGLVRLGQTQMMVIFDFAFNGQTYRIKREFMLTYGKPYASLEVGLLDAQTDKTIPLADKTIRDTQHKIDTLLKLDYDSFINSAFLRQGQANEFSKKTPKERKEVLATILGLNQYEAVRKLAADKVRSAQAECANIELLIEQCTQELQQNSVVTQKLAHVEETLKNIHTREQQLEQQRQRIAAEKNKIVQLQKQHDMLTFQAQQQEREEHNQLEILRALVTTWRTINKKQRHIVDHTLLAQQKILVEAEIKTHQEQLQKNLELKEQYLMLKESAHTIEKQAHEESMTALHKQHIQVEQLSMMIKNNITQQQDIKFTHEQIMGELKQIRHEVKNIDTVLQQSLTHRTHAEREIKIFEKRKDFYQRFVTYGTMLTTELTELAHKQTLSHDDANPCCPLCEQNLSAARRRFLKTKFTEQEAWLVHRRNRIKRVLTTLKAILIEQHASLEVIKKQQQTHQMLALKKEELMNNVVKLEQNKIIFEKKAEKLQLEHAALLKEQAEAQKALAQAQEKKSIPPQLLEIQKKITAIEQALARTPYNQAHHNAAQAELKKIELQRAEYAQLTQEISKQNERAVEIHDLCTHIKKIRSATKALVTEIQALSFLPHQTQQLEKQEAELLATVTAIVQEKGTILQEKGSLEHQRTMLAKLETTHKQHQQKMAQLTETVDEYLVIAQAMGKDGIQALLIEDALPEIEQEANDLLGKLTNNQSHIIIESLRDLKKGGMKETLDIKISDSVGIRPYEMFSGGEAFRIDFALRIAISKLLARRAGTSLQTLIIDEGFGSQDEEGLGHIMDALYKIQEDFAKIIIVSHLPTMKDQFPVHFVIDKGPQGSRVSVVEQG